MGWAYGVNQEGREVGYGVDATCDFDGCTEQIDRGIAFVCGGMHDGGDFGCGKYFCGKHLYGAGLCADCKDNNACPTCEGEGILNADEGIECEACDGLGERELSW